MVTKKFLIAIAFSLISAPVMAQKKSPKRHTPPEPTIEQQTEKKMERKAGQRTEPQKIDSAQLKDDGYVAASSTHIDFSETAIDGRMKVPEGFMLQGRQNSQLSQMVKLRSNFRNELNNSKSATKALVK